jgi:hypothetical protein
MKNNNILLSSSIFIFLIAFNFQTCAAQQCKYNEYYQLTDEAKKHYSSKKYKEASKYYKLAFSKIDFPLGHDLSFALFTANKAKDDFWAAEIAEKLAKGGVPMRYFIQFKKKKWYSKFESEFNNYTQYFNENFNITLRKELMLLLNKDIENTNKYHQWRNREIQINFRDLIDERKKILSDFEKKISKYGFPNEKLIGYNYIRKKNIIEPFKFNVLMVHIYQFGVPLLKSAISTIACEGGLPPNYEKVLENIQGFGNSTGIEQEMKARYKKFRGTDYNILIDQKQ